MISLTVSEAQLEKIIDYQTSLEQQGHMAVNVFSVVNLRFTDRYCVLIDCSPQQAMWIHLLI